MVVDDVTSGVGGKPTDNLHWLQNGVIPHMSVSDEFNSSPS